VHYFVLGRVRVNERHLPLAPLDPTPIRYANGSTYDGDFDQGRRHGLGTFTDPTGVTSFSGSWVNGQREASAPGRNIAAAPPPPPPPAPTPAPALTQQTPPAATAPTTEAAAAAPAAPAQSAMAKRTDGALVVSNARNHRGDEYSGESVNGKPHGQGKMR